MRRHLSSFLVRVWDRADGTVKVEVEHIQDGTRVVVDTMVVALRWIEDRVAAHASDAHAGEVDPAGPGALAEGEPSAARRGPGTTRAGR